MVRCVPFAIALLAVVGLLCLSGCLEFEEQDVSWAYDAERDRLDVQLVYRGIHARDRKAYPGVPTTEAALTAAQVDRLLAGRRLCALQQASPIGFDLDELEEEGATQLVRSLLDRVAIDNGDFFRDADGRLCGWQRIRINGFTEFLQRFDQLLRLSIVRPRDREEFLETFGLHDKTSRALVARAIERAGSLLSHRSGLLVLHVPASEAEARAWLARFEPEFVTADRRRVDERPHRDEDPDYAFTLNSLHWIGAKAVATSDGIEITLGDPDQPGHLCASPKRAPARSGAELPPDNVAPLLAERHAVIRTDVTEESLARDFAEFRRY